MMACDNTVIKQKTTGDDHGVNSTKAVTMHAKNLASDKGRAFNESNEKSQVTIDAAFHGADNGRIEVLKLFNLSKRRRNDHFNRSERVAKMRADCTKETEKERASAHAHSELGAHIDTTTFKFDIINDFKHSRRACASATGME